MTKAAGTRGELPAASAGSASWEVLVERFDAAWRTGQPPRIETFLTSAPPSAQRDLLIALIKVDLEYRWRKPPAVAGALPARPRLEHYLALLPALAPRVPLELIGEEYHVRHWLGDRPARAEYLQRFRLSAEQAAALFDPIDRELASIKPSGITVAPTSTPVRGAEPLSVAEFITALQLSRLVPAARITELRQDQNRFATAPALASHLVRMGLLTPLQGEFLLKGRGGDLTMGPYVLLDRLGQGWSSIVFRARHTLLDRLVALKVIRKELIAELGPELGRRFLQEMQALGRVSHPNIVAAYDAGPIGSTYFLALEHVEGIELSTLVERNGPLAPAEACAYVRQAALGLQHAHECGLVHRDLKPSNLLLANGGVRTAESRAESGTVADTITLVDAEVPSAPRGGSVQSVRDPQSAIVKILDLGLARLHLTETGRSQSHLTGGGDLLGTPDYMAPEQAEDPHHADVRADIYSLGCTLFFLLTGQPPFSGGNIMQKLKRHREEEAASVQSHRRGIPTAVAEVVKRCLAKRPEDRYQTPAELAAALADAGSTSFRVPLAWVVGSAAALAAMVFLVVAWQGIRWVLTARTGEVRKPVSTGAPSRPTPTPEIADAGFARPNVVENGRYAYGPVGTPWTFLGNSGIASDGSAWGAITAPDGDGRAAFLQGNPNERQGLGLLGSISQSIYLAPGTYTVTFQAARRSGQVQPIQFRVNGRNVGRTITPAGSDWTAHTTAAFTIIAAGNHAIEFSATMNDGDNTTFIDAVRIDAAREGSLRGVLIR